MKKININREELSTEEINKHKNFKNVIGNAYKIPKPLYKTPKFFGGILLIVAIATVLFLEYIGSDDTIQKSEFISPPIPSLNIKDSCYKVDAMLGDTIKHSSGTKIIIPANAFVDDNGKIVAGEVEIKYREFHNQADIFFSGIPMEYDSGATKFQLESAGMCEIKGYQNNKAVFVNKQKSLVVNMPSNYAGAGYNMYYLDTIKKNWAFTGKDSINNSLAEEAEKYFLENKDEKKSELVKCAVNYISAKKEVKKTENMMPAEPKMASPNKESFAIEVDESEFPEIAVYKDVLFEISDNKKINKADTDIEWNDVVLKKLNTKGNYFVKFICETKSTEFNVIPVFEGKSYDEAKKIFEKKFTSYQSKLEDKREDERRAEIKLKEELAKQKIEQEKLLKEYAAQRIKDSLEYLKQVEIAKVEAEKYAKEEAERLAEYKKQMEEEIRKADVLTKVTRTFQINGFGIINCDNPKVYPTEISVVASFITAESKNLKFSNIYLVDKNKNTVFTYSKESGMYGSTKSLSKFGFNPESSNIVWSVLDEKHIGIVSKEKLIGKFTNGEKKAFEMEVIEVSNQSSDELKKLLDL
jgi:hypothetical protein